MKKLLGILVIAMSISSCEKNTELTNGTQNTYVLDSKEMQPTSVMSPTAFFVDNDTLWSITNLSAANPTVLKKGKISNIYILGEVNQNVFNTNSFMYSKQGPIYNPFIDRMVVIDPFSGNVLNKCFTPSRTNSTVKLPNTKSNGIAVKISPDNKVYYFSIREEKSEMGTSKLVKELRSINMDGTNDIGIINYNLNPDAIPPANGGEINFDDNLLYTPNAEDGNLYVTEIKNLAKSKVFLPAIFGESFKKSVIKYDPIHKKIFFSTIIESLKKRRIYSIDISGNFNTIKKILEVTEAKNINPIPGDHTFTFDILPGINTIVWCKRDYIRAIDKHIATIGKINMDGADLKLLHTGAYINTIVAAEPLLSHD